MTFKLGGGAVPCCSAATTAARSLGSRGPPPHACAPRLAGQPAAPRPTPLPPCNRCSLAQALPPSPAGAGEVVPTVQGSLVKQQQEELQRLLEQRGAKLPELRASPNVRQQQGVQGSAACLPIV